MKKVRRIGVHTSIAGGIHLSLERARELGCNTIQIFSHNPRSWFVKDRDKDELNAFREIRGKYDISPVYIHTSYLINLAAAGTDLLGKSIDMVVYELNIADAIGAEYIVLHTGSSSGEDPKVARKRAISCLKEIAQRGSWKAGILLENTAGERGDITSKINEIAGIYNSVSGELISGICIDTCHAFSAGYELRTEEGINSLLFDIQKYTGRDAVKLVHVNDCKGHLGSGVDRHEHIGKGSIGIAGFRKILNCPELENIPVILETPKKSEDDDPRNLRIVREIVSHKKSEIHFDK